MSLRVLGTGYANAALGAAVSLLKEDASGAIAVKPDNQRVRLCAVSNAVWIKLTARGSAIVAATAGTANEILLPAGWEITLLMGMDWSGLSVINDTGAAKFSAHLVEESDDE